MCPDATLQPQNDRATCLIVGAGMAGLIAAHALLNAGFQVKVFDKGRGVGGRMATRRFGNGVFDHGAQFVTARDPRFQSLLKTWLQNGIASRWADGFVSEQGHGSGKGHARYRGMPGMTAIPKALAISLSEEVDIQLRTRIELIEQLDDRWVLTADTHAVYHGEALLLTPPVPQSIQLLDQASMKLPPFINAQLNDIAYHPCIALLALFDEPTKVPHPGAIQFEKGNIRWMADNQQKGISPDAAAVTIHAAPQFSVEHWSSPDAHIVERLLAEAAPWLPDAVPRVQIHRWRYSQPVDRSRNSNIVVAEPLPLAFAGDAFAGGRVEGAAISGLQAADWLMTVV